MNMYDDITRYIQLLESVTLNEKMLEIDDDVERLYQTFFHPIFEKIGNKEFDDVVSFRRYMATMYKMEMLSDLIDDGVITSPELKKVSELRPNFMLEFNKSSETGGMYIADDDVIIVSLSTKDFELLIAANYDIDTLKDMVGSSIKYVFDELQPRKIKGTIHHELAHLYDDTINNQHIKKWNDSPDKNKGVVHNTKFEIEGIMHTIKQFRKDMSNWDSMTFDDMVNRIPSVSAIRDDMVDDKPLTWEYWKRKVKQRMAREGLLGSNMR